jgi:hypothetical protein
VIIPVDLKYVDYAYEVKLVRNSRRPS